jgi:hypothetical protein
MTKPAAAAFCIAAAMTVVLWGAARPGQLKLCRSYHQQKEEYHAA